MLIVFGSIDSDDGCTIINGANVGSCQIKKTRDKVRHYQYNEGVRHEVFYYPDGYDDQCYYDVVVFFNNGPIKYIRVECTRQVALTIHTAITKAIDCNNVININEGYRPIKKHFYE